MKIFRYEKWKTSTGMSDESSMHELFISDLRVTEYKYLYYHYSEVCISFTSS